MISSTLCVSRSTNEEPKPNNDGYGFCYYPVDGSFHYNEPGYDDQAWYLTGEDNVYYNLYNELDPDNVALDTAEQVIMNNGNNAAIVFGHARAAGSDYITGSHPFRFDWNGKTYTFIHNGELSSDAGDLKEMIASELSGWAYSSNWTSNAPGSTWIDSELLFHYIMKNIIAESGDIVSGIYKALNNTLGHPQESIWGYINAPGNFYNIVNFTLSDGESLYTFRNRDDSSHRLSYKENNEFYCVKTFEDFTDGEAIAENELVVFTSNGISKIPGFLKSQYQEFDMQFLSGTITQDIDCFALTDTESRLWLTGDITIPSGYDINVLGAPYSGTEIGVLANIEITIDGKITINDGAGLHLNHGTTVNVNSGGELFLDWGSTLTGAVAGDRINAYNGGKITTDFDTQNPGSEITIASSTNEKWDGIFIDTPDNAENIWFVNCDISGINNFSLETTNQTARTKAYLNFHYTDFQDCGSLTVKNGHHFNFMGESATTKSEFKNNEGSLSIYQSTFDIQNTNFELNGAPVYLYDSSPSPNDPNIIKNCIFDNNTGEGLRINNVHLNELSGSTITNNSLYGILCFNGTSFNNNQFKNLSINNNGSTEYIGWPGTFEMDDPNNNIFFHDSNYSGGSDNYLLCNIAWDGSTPVNIKGTNITSVDHLFPINTDAWIYYPQHTVAKDLLDLAEIDFANGNYADAQISLYQLLDDYLTSPEAVQAVYFLYHIEVITNPTCEDLRTYLDNIKVNASSYLYTVIQQVYAKTLIKDKDYIQAIEVLEDIIITTTFPDEALVAMIDQGFAYVNLPEGRSAQVSNCTMKPKSFADYEAKVEELNRQFSFYPTEEEQQQDGIVSAKLSSTMNYPNPFNPTTTISYNLAADSQVELTVYNVKGQKVKTLVNDTQQAGARTVEWNGLDSSNNPVSSGIYFYKIKTDADVKMSKMILMK